jgi:hypothetical protein
MLSGRCAVVAQVLRDFRVDPAGGDLTRQHPHPRRGRTPRAVLEPGGRVTSGRVTSVTQLRYRSH